MRRLRFLVVPAAIVGVVWAMAAPASASTIVQPPSGFTAPLNAQRTGPAPFLIKATGYTNGDLVHVEVCDGVPSSDPHWDPGSDCDTGTEPVSVTAKADGSVTWDPTKPGQDIVVFDGASPSGTFNCLYPGEPSPNNSLPDFTNCQVKVSILNTQVTSDQSLQTFTLPVPPGGTTTTSSSTTSTTRAVTTTTTTTPGATTTTTVPTATTTTSSTTTTTTAGATTTSSTSASSTSSTTTHATTATTASSGTTPPPDPGSGKLAFAGTNARRVVGIGLVLLIMGFALVALHRRNPGR